MRILGIDQALDHKAGFAVVEFDDDGHSHIVYTYLEEYAGLSHGDTDRERCRRFGKVVQDIFTKYMPDCAVTELVRKYHKGHPANPDTLIMLAKAEAVVSVVLPGKCKLFISNTASWKATVLGSGRATKTEAVAYVLRHYGVVLSEHEAEAVCQAVFIHKTNYALEDGILMMA